jgi:hypothetical protein
VKPLGAAIENAILLRRLFPWSIHHKKHLLYWEIVQITSINFCYFDKKKENIPTKFSVGAPPGPLWETGTSPNPLLPQVQRKEKKRKKKKKTATQSPTYKS